MKYSFIDLKDICGGAVIGSGQQVFTNILTDSRSLLDPENTLFFAITGKYHDGHKYVEELYAKGVRQFVIEKSLDVSSWKEASFLQCTSSLTAIQALSEYHRKQSNIATVGITGSNGKTIVKEWLYQLLNADFQIVKSPKSYNSQIGVPLSIWQINKNHNLGIFEAGISTLGEMEKLEPVIKPSEGIITNIGSAHNAGFEDISSKLKEKLKIFKNTKRLIYCRDHEIVHYHISLQKIPSYSWGEHISSDLRILGKSIGHNETNLTLEDGTLKLPFTDSASIENAMHCVTYMHIHGYDIETINKRVGMLKSIPMRLELKNGIQGCKIIDDTYNNDLAGINIALEFMEQQNTGLDKVLILSDILQAGDEEDIYSELAGFIIRHNISKLIGIGKAISFHLSNIQTDHEFYASTKEFLAKFNPTSIKEAIILIKGARNFSFESIVNVFQEKIHGTRLEINLNALTRNLNFYRTKLDSSTKLMVMVKAFAYGSGSFEIAQLLQHHKVDYLGVAYVDEGVDLRKNGIHLPIMVMNPTQEGLKKAIEYNLEPEIFSLSILRALIETAKSESVRIHLKLETGMNRLGFKPNEVDQLIALLKENQQIQVKSIFTHLAGADDEQHNEYSKKQIEIFLSGSNKIMQNLKINPLMHVLNSAGILRFPEYQFDMVRLGIGLYGIDSNSIHQDHLEVISTLKTVISQINTIKKGETIGYGRKGVANHEMKIATIAIGYADGYSRAFSNGNGVVLINGKKAPVVGNVCMDMTMVDITDIEAKEGDTVEIFGKELSIIELANRMNTIPYEILTNVNARVKRVFYLD